MAILLSLLALPPAFYGMSDFWFLLRPNFRVKGKRIKSQEESRQEKNKKNNKM
jgi:hypothetical protein